jgi:hypothetical protein
MMARPSRWELLARAYADLIWWVREHRGVPLELSKQVEELELELGMKSWPRKREREGG